MGTNSPRCIPDRETRFSMKAAGCTFRSEGKRLTEREITNLESAGKHSTPSKEE